MRCVSSESCLCNSEKCGFLQGLWSSSPNHHPRSERCSNLSCQCSLWPSRPLLQYICCLKQTARLTKKKKMGQLNNADVEEDQIIAGTCGRSHQVSVDGARSVCSVCQGDVPQETIEETIVFKFKTSRFKSWNKLWKWTQTVNSIGSIENNLPLLQSGPQGVGGPLCGQEPVLSEQQIRSLPGYSHQREAFLQGPCVHHGCQVQVNPWKQMLQENHRRSVQTLHTVHHQSGSHKSNKWEPLHEELLLKYILTLFLNSCFPL